MNRNFFWIMLIALIFSFNLLVACGGGGARSVQNTSTTTKGEELIDLKRAYNFGILNESEYNEQREIILDGD